MQLGRFILSNRQIHDLQTMIYQSSVMASAVNFFKISTYLGQKTEFTNRL